MHASWDSSSTPIKKAPLPRIAPGFEPSPKHNMKYYGGHTITDMLSVLIFVGSQDWDEKEARLLEKNINLVMTDDILNNVVNQYFDKPVTYTQFPIMDLSGPVPEKFTRHSIQDVLEDIYPEIEGMDFKNTVFNLLLPPGVVLTSRGMPDGPQYSGEDPHAFIERHGAEGHEQVLTSEDGLGGYHGSAIIDGNVIYYTVCVYSEKTKDGVRRGMPYWEDSWKNVASVLYHELQEARTSPDIEESIRHDDDSMLGWYNEKGGEVADYVMRLAGRHLGLGMREVVVEPDSVSPIQLLWSNRVNGPECSR